MILSLAVPLGLVSCVTTPPSVPRLASPSPLPVTARVTVADVPAHRALLAGLGAQDQVRATLCLASAIYFEAATEPDEGQRAVAQVVLNRVRHPGWPNTVCGVVYQGSDQAGCQFSFACNGAMARTPSLIWWTRARRVAEAALAGDAYEPVGSATFYHTSAVAPAWRLRLVPVATIGAHIFYRQPQDAPNADLLPLRYAGHEPAPGPLPRIVPPVELAQLTIPAPMPAASALPPMPIAPAPQPVAADKPYEPYSDILPQYRDSGQWIAGK